MSNINYNHNTKEIIMSEFNINCSNVNENADILNAIIEELAIETEAYIPNIIKTVADHYSIHPSHIISALKTINSDFTANNNIICYYCGKPIKRTTYTCAQRRIIEKIAWKAKRAYYGTENAAAIFMNSIYIILDNNASLPRCTMS